jgi:hypothetical protein
MAVSRQCPECGCDRWVARDAGRARDRAERTMEEAEKMAARAGVDYLRQKLARAEDRDHVSRLQRKIQRQARVIVRLEARLRALNAKPYTDSPVGENAPAAEKDADAWDAKGDA